ncbi:MAG: MBL fold metallo-hydrolase [Clostridia bacterium]|nr:MBL fold metallo-hydrolase [Clostridia bacterium]
MGFFIKMGDTVLSVDYYASDRDTRLVKAPIPASEVHGIDIFLGTHNHLDHIDHASWQIWANTCPDAVFVFPGLHVSAILADGIDKVRQFPLTDSTCCQIGDITIHAIAAAHEFLARDPVTNLYPCLQYIIEGNGVRIYHAGDTLRYEGMLPKLQSFGKLDAAILPINGRDAERYRRDCIGNMTFQEAADLAGELKPSLIIPGHWDMFANNPGDPEAFSDYLDAKYGMSCHIPKHAEPIIVKA